MGDPVLGAHDDHVLRVGDAVKGVGRGRQEPASIGAAEMNIGLKRVRRRALGQGDARDVAFAQIRTRGDGCCHAARRTGECEPLDGGAVTDARVASGGIADREPTLGDLADPHLGLADPPPARRLGVVHAGREVRLEDDVGEVRFGQGQA